MKPPDALEAALERVKDQVCVDNLPLIPNVLLQTQEAVPGINAQFSAVPGQKKWGVFLLRKRKPIGCGGGACLGIARGHM